MTTERELLTLAAKACGYKVKFVIGKYAKNDNLGLFMINHGTSNERRWNPKRSDGDCARMEAALEINLRWHTKDVHVKSLLSGSEWYEKFSDHAGDKNAARRAASVVVASEIGRLM